MTLLIMNLVITGAYLDVFSLRCWRGLISASEMPLG